MVFCDMMEVRVDVCEFFCDIGLMYRGIFILECGWIVGEMMGNYRL